MPIIYYTQEEVDELVRKGDEQVAHKLAQKLEENHAALIRSWILYTLRPYNLTDKQLRQKLDEAVKTTRP